MKFLVNNDVSTQGPRGRVLLTGASGLVGRALAQRLRADGREVIELAHRPRPGALTWQPEQGQFPAEALEGVEAVVHLAGENIGQRWSTEIKRRIRDSRLLPTQLLAGRMAALPVAQRPKVFVCASAIGFYGVQRPDLVDETATSGKGFLAEVTREWEAATGAASAAGVRTVCARMGVVLGSEGGALKELVSIFRKGLGGHAGPGTQRISWIALSDLVEIFLFLLERHDLAGPVNAVAPVACPNRELAETLGRILEKSSKTHAPAFALKLLLGEMAGETILSDLAVIPRRLQEAGFVWHFAGLEAALRHELARESRG